MISFQPTFNSILMIFIGLALIVFAVFLGLNAWSRMFAVGFLCTGFGCILFGITNGFTDMTPTGRLLFRIALVAFAIGIPVIGYFLYREMR
jgi:hypothetical protein